MPQRAQPFTHVFQWCVRIGCALVLVWVGLIGLRAMYPLSFRTEVLRYSAQNDLEPALIASIIRSESRFHPNAVSDAGAIGLMQIMPDSGAWIAEQLFLSSYSPDQLTDPSVNLSLGTWYVRYLLDRYGTLETALWAYNAGPSRVDTWLNEGSAPYSETQIFAARVQHHITAYRVALRLSWLYAIVPAWPL